MPKIELNKLKKIIREEMISITEGANHDAASKNMSGATKLLNAIENFKNNASERVKADLAVHLDGITKLLDRIVASPMQYVDVTKPPMKKVTLKAQK